MRHKDILRNFLAKLSKDRMTNKKLYESPDRVREEIAILTKFFHHDLLSFTDNCIAIPFCGSDEDNNHQEL